MYERIVVALDGTPEAEAVLPHVQLIADKFQSHISLVHVDMSAAQLLAVTSTDVNSLGPMITDPTPILDAERDAMETYLRGVAARLQAPGRDIDWAALEGDPSQQVVAYAQQKGAGLIALTTHGRAGLQRILFGSVADSILRHTSCPVLMVRMPEPGTDSKPPESH